MSLQQPGPAQSPAEAGPENDDLLLDEPDEPAPAGPSLLLRCGAELFGTFFLVFVGVGVGMYGQFSNAGDALAVALAFGIAAIAGGVAIGHVSGAHLNPAISLGAAISGRFAWADLVPYWLSQVVGGTLAAALLFLTVPDGLNPSSGARGVVGQAANGYGEHSPLAHLAAASNVDIGFSVAAALLVEVVATAVLVAVVLAATRRDGDSSHAPYAIGLTLAVGLLVATPITNGSLNPARSTATAIFGESWALGQLWLFWVAPLLGAAVAGLLYRAFTTVPADLAGEDYDADDEDDEDEPESANEPDADGSSAEDEPENENETTAPTALP